MINHEIKGNLARLLATEDLVVEHRKVSTASFNVHTRVLTLPIWERASSVVYDMLVGHEVGHALYTPNEDWTKVKNIPKSYVNITEDVRIEKLMKRKYAGLNKTFYTAYNELHESDFFCLGSDRIEEYNLADRINLHFKIGNFIDIPFSEEESSIVKAAADTETFQDAVNVAEMIYKYCVEQKKKNPTKPNIDLDDIGESGSCEDIIVDECEETTSSEESLTSEVESDSNFEDSDVNSETDSGDIIKDGGTNPNDKTAESEEIPEVKTDRALTENIEKLINKHAEERNYIELPKLNLDKIIISPQKIHSIFSEYESKLKSVNGTDRDPYYFVDQKYSEFKKSVQKEVSYLVKEFECKKAADSYARASTSRTGVLDTKALHTYKFNEDIFKRVTTLADGKNHGLVFILDWSGSMSNVLLDTVKQLFNLIWFCKKVGIEFEVYAFTDSYFETEQLDCGTVRKILPRLAYTKAENIFSVDREFKLLNFISSKKKLSELDANMKNIFRLAYYYTCSQYSIPEQFGLSSTPLNEAIVSLHQLIPNFQKKYNVQKLHCILLTDGESNHSSFHKVYRDDNVGNPIFGIKRIDKGTFLRIRKTGRVYSFGNPFFETTKTLIRSVKDCFPEINFIGIRLLGVGDRSTFIRQHLGYDKYNEAKQTLKKENSLAISTSGFDKYFGIVANSLSRQVDFNVSENSTKSSITNAFKKSLSAKKMNKKFLGEFVSLIS